MPPPGDHAALLARRDFPIPPGDLTAEERDLLSRFGCWLEALAVGRIAPVTPDQERFVQVARGEQPAQTPYERVWVKVMHLRAEVAGTFARLTHARATAAAVEAEYLARRAAVLAMVQDELATIDEAFADRMREATEAATAADQAARSLVLRLGHTVHAPGVTIAYHPGRATWDNERLRAYADSHPEIRELRKVGKPWVVVRYADAHSPPPPPTIRQLPPADAPDAEPPE